MCIGVVLLSFAEHSLFLTSPRTGTCTSLSKGGNIQTVSSIGVTSILTPDGVEQTHFEQALEQYAVSKQ